MRQHCLLLTSLFYASQAFAVPLHTLEAMLPAGSQLSLSIYDTASKKSLVKRGDNMLLPPASTLKMVTALAASLSLPKDFTFKTDVYQVKNDLVFKFGGDPTLTRKDLQKLLKTIKKKGVNVIKGNIWLDGTIFTGYERAVGWPWDILGVCYSAPSSAISLDKNCVQGSVYSEKGKKITRVFVPKNQPVSVKSEAITVTPIQQKETRCDLELHYSQTNTYKLTGCLSFRTGPLALKFAVQNPQKYLQDILVMELKRSGIKFKGKIKIGALDKPSVLIASHASKKRDELLKIMLKNSNNILADNLLKMIGHQYYGQPGSFANGAMAVKQILEKQAGIDLNHAVIVDGSGLSRNNRITAAQLIDVIAYYYKHPKRGLVDMLPVSGVDGTLKYRFSVRYPPLKETLKAKTGSLYGSHNLAGVFKNNKGQDFFVVQLVTNYHIPETKKLSHHLASPITQFERELFQALHKSSLTTQKKAHR